MTWKGVLFVLAAGNAIFLCVIYELFAVQFAPQHAANTTAINLRLDDITKELNKLASAVHRGHAEFAEFAETTNKSIAQIRNDSIAMHLAIRNIPTELDNLASAVQRGDAKLDKLQKKRKESQQQEARRQIKYVKLENAVNIMRRSTSIRQEAQSKLQEVLQAPSTGKYHFKNFRHDLYLTVAGDQHGQAAWVDTVLQTREKLFVVESGAWDGEEMSNSIGFETLRHWECLLVEANPAAQKAIIKKNRHCWLLKGGLVAKPTFFTNQRLWMAGGVGGFPETISDEGLARSAIATSQTLTGSRAEFSGAKVDVPCFPLDFVMGEMNRTTIDYWSLDTEGSELNILRNTDFGKIEVGVMTIEHRHAAGYREELFDFMLGVGFVRCVELGPDDGYVNLAYFKRRSIQIPQKCGW